MRAITVYFLSFPPLPFFQSAWLWSPRPPPPLPRSSPPSAGQGLCDDITAETRGLPAPGPGTPERRLTGVARKDNAFQVSPSQSQPSQPALSAPFTSNSAAPLFLLREKPSHPPPPPPPLQLLASGQRGPGLEMRAGVAGSLPAACHGAAGRCQDHQ